jgi:hypothetical protein
MTAKFGGMMEAQSQTFLGKWSTFKDKVSGVLQDVGKALLPLAKKALEALQPMLNMVKGMAEWFGKLPGPVQAALAILAGGAALVGPTLLVIGQLAGGLQSILAIAPMVKAAATAMWASITSPIGLTLMAAVAIGGLFYAMSSLKAHTDNATAALKEQQNVLREIAEKSAKGAAIAVDELTKKQIMARVKQEEEMLTAIRQLETLHDRWEKAGAKASEVGKYIKQVPEAIRAKTTEQELKGYFTTGPEAVSAARSLAKAEDLFYDRYRKAILELTKAGYTPAGTLRSEFKSPLIGMPSLSGVPSSAVAASGASAEASTDLKTLVELQRQQIEELKKLQKPAMAVAS